MDVCDYSVMMIVLLTCSWSDTFDSFVQGQLQIGIADTRIASL